MTRVDYLIGEYEKYSYRLNWINSVRMEMASAKIFDHHSYLNRIYVTIVEKMLLLDEMIEDEECWRDLGYVD